jgi:hypothetical protein
VFPVTYKLGCYIPEEGIVHSHRRKNLKSYIVFVVVLEAVAIAMHKYYDSCGNNTAFPEPGIPRCQLTQVASVPEYCASP